MDMTQLVSVYVEISTSSYNFIQIVILPPKRIHSFLYIWLKLLNKLKQDVSMFSTL